MEFKIIGYDGEEWKPDSDGKYRIRGHIERKHDVRILIGFIHEGSKERVNEVLIDGISHGTFATPEDCDKYVDNFLKQQPPTTEDQNEPNN